MYKEKLPNDQLALVFSIIALALLLLGCCCGLFAIVSLGLAITALVIAVKGLKLYDANPEAYVESSKNNLTASKIMGIIGIVLSAVILFIQIGYFALVGTMATTESWKTFLENLGNNRKTERTYDATDTIYTEMPVDTVATDTITFE
ncbi:CCC motif membrane protein [Flavobacterium sp.]|uniref:CCC motif membrane protein n=1 Tax=Flavobacterium sp. TaxID=239 RepID=UPI001204CCD7|nr:CCC motif membrane protein [Flavobacterium sp.]RZJ72434.1 MAG: hypothetical protein EOO49_05845 [Flavobacterium sp.]